MASNRAGKSGFAKEAQDKMNAKYNKDAAKEALGYIANVLEEPELRSEDGDSDEFYEKLKDGMVLARFGNWITPGSVKMPKNGVPPKLAFKQMELIGLFLTSVEKIVEPTSLFQTVDLFERVNLSQVVICIQDVGSEMLTQGRPGYGVAKSKGTKKEWTQEQLNAGKGIIGLQMGTNKGASAAGQNFGKSRMITD